MMRLLSIGIDCVSSAIFVIPALAILQCTIYRKWEFKPFCVKLIFAFYAIALFSVVGVPAVGIFQMDFGLNLIPFADIVNSPFAYMKNTILNIVSTFLRYNHALLTLIGYDHIGRSST